MRHQGGKPSLKTFPSLVAAQQMGRTHVKGQQRLRLGSGLALAQSMPRFFPSATWDIAKGNGSVWVENLKCSQPVSDLVGIGTKKASALWFAFFGELVAGSAITRTI